MRLNRPPTRWIASAALTAALLALCGCTGALVGEWSFVRASPDRQGFSLDDTRFTADGTYSSLVTRAGRTRDEHGAYSFNGFKLVLRPADGGIREFDVALRGNELELRRTGEFVLLRRRVTSTPRRHARGRRTALP